MGYTRDTKGTRLVGALQLRNGTLLFDGSGAPTDGTSGTGAGFASTGSVYTDVATGTAYRNVNTKASPTWQPTGSAVDAAREVSNKSGSTITAGKLVALSGWDETAQLPTIVLADADADLPADHVLPASIVNNATGLAKSTFRLTAQATNGFAVGDAVYLSATAGGWTHTAPTAANAVQQVVGKVAVVHATTGVVELDVRPVTVIDTDAIQAKAVTPGKIALADTHLLVGGAGGAAADVALSGDATLANTGVLTLAATQQNVQTYRGAAGSGAGAGSNLDVAGGVGGATGNGGYANVSGGAGGSTSGDGGTVALAGGAASTSGAGGAISVSGGAAAGTGKAGGAVTLSGGASSGGGASGAATVSTPAGTAGAKNGGNAGAIAVTAGAGAAAVGAGGGNGGNGGSITLTLGLGGAKDGGGANGAQGQFSLVNLPTADPKIAGAWWANAGLVTVSAG